MWELLCSKKHKKLHEVEEITDVMTVHEEKPVK